MLPKRNLIFFTELFLIGFLLPASFLYSLLSTGWLNGVSDSEFFIPLPLLALLVFMGISVWLGFFRGMKNKVVRYPVKDLRLFASQLSEKLEMEMRVHLDSGDIMLSNELFVGTYVLILKETKEGVVMSSCMTDRYRRWQRASFFAQHLRMDNRIILELSSLSPDAKNKI
ncbi:MAG: hypothetical protein K1X56_14815 [Flavobacteriales bacterium]|nr:hypothetical protein [Flavobacteriales bacterium]